MNREFFFNVVTIMKVDQIEVFPSNEIFTPKLCGR